jgi:regulator of sigma E protease
VPYILAAIVAFGAMIFVHELGHFLVARRAGVLIHAFAIGFGPRVISWRRGPTTYSVNLLPFGGYVRMEGEDDEGSGVAGSFRTRNVGWRMAIIAGGPAMNLLLAALIFAVVAAIAGVPVSTRVGSLEAGWPAAAAGIHPGDVILAINGQPMTQEELIRTINRSAGREIALLIRRDGREMTIVATPRLDSQRGVGRLGFSLEQVLSRLGLAEAVLWGVGQTGKTIATLGTIIGMLIREGAFLENLGGPLAAGSMLTQAARSGLATYLHLTAFLSVMIGIFNLLPLPALDGGRLAFLLVEAVRRRPVDPRQEGWIHMVGFALLLLLLLVLTVQDLRRLLGIGG